MKYRKKPVVIEAIQFDGSNYSQINDWASQSHDFTYSIKGEMKINTLEGVMVCNINDWIIKGVNGEFYPCKPDIFEKTYEEVRETV